MHVSVPWPFFHGQTKSELWWSLYGPIDHQHPQHDTAEAVSDRILEGQKQSQYERKHRLGRVRRTLSVDPSTMTGLIELCRQHLANALKYSSAFPVIVLSALQRGTDPKSIGMSEAGLFRLW